MVLLKIAHIVRCPKHPARINVIKTYCRVCFTYASSDGKTVDCTHPLTDLQKKEYAQNE